jgi:phosphate regulon transcriptional regulator PhoB
MSIGKILVVDDEEDLIELISSNFQGEGFERGFAFSGAEAISRIRRERFSLVLLDLMLPGMPGMEVCRILRSDLRTRNLPIIMLTARGEEADRIVGLEMGADDYVTKPFSPRELVARVKTVLRRAAAPLSEAETVDTGDLAIDRGTFTVSKKGIPLSLSSTEFRLLLYLVEKKGKVFSREQLLDAVWKDDAFVEPRTVDVHIRRIRKQIEDDPANPLYLKTRRGIGYYFDGKTDG